jgi:CubicO group peptidase (beta-lactamase class C family)
MSSGAAVEHAGVDYSSAEYGVYPRGFTAADANVDAVVGGWNRRREPAGTRWNYNELCPMAIGAVIRAVTGGTLSAFCEAALWQPLGAEADATWSTDSIGHEFNCVGFGARLRDWARLGQLVAQRGEMGGRRIVRCAKPIICVAALTGISLCSVCARHETEERGLGQRALD